MNSKIFKKPFIKVEITTATISGSMLARKLESWCEAEPSVLMWEISHDEAPIRQYTALDDFEAKNLRETQGGNWRIEFQLTRANSTANGLFNGVAIIAGTIKTTLEIVNDRSQEAYFLVLNSRSIHGEKVFTSAAELWQTLTNLGQIRTIK